MTMFRAEVRRTLHRRVVWCLIGLALAGIAIAGLAVFADSGGRDVATLRTSVDPHAALASSWWVSGTADGTLMVAALFLAVGGLIGGSIVAGGEWRAGTVATLLTWEPRRWRVHAARLAACAGLA